MKRRLRAPSPALVISLIALFVALGGTSYAAIHLPKNSVGSKQLKKNAVTGVKIKNHAVSAVKINTHGLTVPNAAHATSADSATNATNATNATHATSADGLTPLPSGKSESGVFATGDGGAASAGYIAVTITYPRPLPAAIASANVIDVHGASGTHCPGRGQADPGYLCLYDTDSAGTTGTVFYSDTGPGTGVGTLGVILYWTVGTGPAWTGGSWTVTTP
jgi:hypothetical protein